jgi:hypothetical protein
MLPEKKTQQTGSGEGLTNGQRREVDPCPPTGVIISKHLVALYMQTTFYFVILIGCSPRSPPALELVVAPSLFLRVNLISTMYTPTPPTTRRCMLVAAHILCKDILTRRDSVIKTL